MGTFKDDRTLGQQGQEQVWQRRRKFFPGHELVDCRGQQRDYEFLLRVDSENSFGVTVKTERVFTGNLFLEVSSNTTKKTDGWFWTTKADVLVAGFVDKDHWYMVLMNEARKLELKKFRTVYAKTHGRNGQVLYETAGVLLPVAHPVVTLLWRP